MKAENSTIEKIETLGEAVANSITHGFGLLLSISALVILIICASLHDNTLKIISSEHEDYVK